MRKHTLAALLMGCILLLLPAAAQAELPDENGEGFLGTTFETMRREIQEGERDVGILLYVQLSSIEEYREGLAEGEILEGDSFGYCVNTLTFQVYSTVYGEWEGDSLTLMASVSPRDFSPAGRYLIQIKEETPKLHYPLVPGFLPEAGDYTLIQWYPVDALGRVYVPTGNVSELGDFLAGEPEVERMGTLLANRVNLRKRAGRSSQSVAVLCKGNALAILGEEKGWYHVRAIANGQALEGFVWGEYVALG